MQTTPIVLEKIAEWLGSKDPQQLRQMAVNDQSLTEDFRPYFFMARIAVKAIPSKVQVNSSEVLAFILQNQPKHGEVLFENRAWFHRNIHDLAGEIGVEVC